MIDHHEFGPSSLGRIFHCAGSANLIRALRESGQLHKEDSEDAKEGTRLHGLIAEVFRDRSVLLYTEEDMQVVERCFWYARDNLPPGPNVVLVEERLEFEDMFGTADLIWRSHLGKYENAVDLVEWKTGRGELDQKTVSLQVQAYCVLASERWRDAELLVGHVYNPVTQESYRSEFTREELELSRSTIHLLIDRASKPDAKRTPHPAACKYCPARAHCPEATDLSFALAERPPQLPVDPKELGELYEKAKYAEAVIEGLLKEIRRRAIHEGLVPDGYEVQKRAAAAKIDDPVVALSLLREAGGTTEQFIAAGSWTLAALKRTTGLSDNRIKEVLGEAIVRCEDVYQLRKERSK